MKNSITYGTGDKNFAMVGRDVHKEEPWRLIAYMRGQGAGSIFNIKPEGVESYAATGVSFTVRTTAPLGEEWTKEMEEKVSKVVRCRPDQVKITVESYR